MTKTKSFIALGLLLAIASSCHKQELTPTHPSIGLNTLKVQPASGIRIAYNPSDAVFSVGGAIKPIKPISSGTYIPATIYDMVTTFVGAQDTTTNSVPTILKSPQGLAIDPNGNVYVADLDTNLIFKVAPAGTVTTYAGNGIKGLVNGHSLSSSFNYPNGLAFDHCGNLYVSEESNNDIRKITPGGLVCTFAGSGKYGFANGKGKKAVFNEISGIAVDKYDNLYVCDLSNHVIRKITPSGVVTTFAGIPGVPGATNGPINQATFNYPNAIAIDLQDNIYVAEEGNFDIRKITPSGQVSTLAGNGTNGFADGQGTSASFSQVYGITIDESGNLYVTDTGNQEIRKITPDGLVTTFAGSHYSFGSINGIGTAANFYAPYGIVINKNGELIISDSNQYRLRKITTTGYTISPALPAGLIFDSATGTISGTPAVSSPQTTYTVKAYVASGASGTTNITITVN